MVKLHCSDFREIKQYFGSPNFFLIFMVHFNNAWNGNALTQFSVFNNMSRDMTKQTK